MSCLLLVGLERSLMGVVSKGGRGLKHFAYYNHRYTYVHKVLDPPL